MLKVYDKNHKALCHINKYKNDIKLEEDLEGGDKTLSFSYLGRHDIQNEFYIETESDEFVVKEINRDSKNEYVSVVCALNLEGLETKSWSELNLYSQTVRQCAEYVLDGTGWTLGDCDVTKVRNIGMVEVNPLKALQNIAYAFICDVKFDSKKKVVSFYEKMGEDKGIYFMNGLNLKRLQKTSKSYDFYTRIIPIGADGLTIASVNGGLDYLENHQYSLKTKTFLWKDENYDNPSALKEDAEKKLEDLSKPELSYSADVIDLARESRKYSVMAYGLGDTVTIIDRVTMTKDVQRIKKLVRYLRDPDKNTCEISNTTLTFDEILSRLRSSEIMVNHTINPDGTIKVSDILNWEGSLYESSMYEELSGQIDDLNQKYTSIGDLIGDADILTAKDIYVEDIASTTDGITKKRVTIGSGADAVSYDYIDNGDFVLLGNSYGAGTMGGSGYFTQISSYGLLRANNAIIYGTIYATDGEFFGTVHASGGTFKDLIVKNKIYMTNTSYGGDPVELVECTGAAGFYFKPWCYFNNGISDGLASNGFNSSGMFASKIRCDGNIACEENITCGDSSDTNTRYVQAQNQYHSIQLRAGNAGNVGIRLDEDTSDACWLIYKDKNGNVQIPGFSGGEGSVDLSSYATKTWVNNQGFLTSVPSSYATRSWVSSNYAPTSSPTFTGEVYFQCSIRKSPMSSGSGRTAIWKSSSNDPSTSDSWLSFSSGSSKRYKHVYEKVTFDEINRLFTDVSIHWFTYRDGYLDKYDERYQKRIPGFIAEDIDNVLPIAVNHLSDGSADVWNSDIIVPLVFAGTKQALYEINILKSDYMKFISLLWKGWKIHDEKFCSQKNELDVMNSIITDLRIEIAEMKRELETLKAS